MKRVRTLKPANRNLKRDVKSEVFSYLAAQICNQSFIKVKMTKQPRQKRKRHAKITSYWTLKTDFLDILTCSCCLSFSTVVSHQRSSQRLISQIKVLYTIWSTLYCVALRLILYLTSCVSIRTSRQIHGWLVIRKSLRPTSKVDGSSLTSLQRSHFIFYHRMKSQDPQPWSCSNYFVWSVYLVYVTCSVMLDSNSSRIVSPPQLLEASAYKHNTLSKAATKYSVWYCWPCWSRISWDV